jgi:glyoxylase-like metal-dependent hydrolase (beta-lactamase superfamily II)
MKRTLIAASIVLSALVVLGLAGLWAVKKGMSPLVDGVQLHDGKVTVVVDRTSPMPVAAYLLRLNDGNLGLVDATMDPEAKAVCAAIHRMGRSESAVKVIFCTHSHDDHTAGCQRFPNATIYAMKPFSQVKSQSNMSNWNRVQKALPGKNQDPAPPKNRDIQYLSDGQTLDFNGDKIEAFAVPGHTYDSCAYLGFGVLFMGDSAAGQYNGQIGSAPPFVSVDRKMNQRELKKLANRLQDRKNEIDCLTFGHQGPIKGLEPLLFWASSH